MRKSILILAIVGAFFAGSLLTPQIAVADHDADFANLANVVGIFFQGTIDVFNTIVGLIGDNSNAIGDLQAVVHVDDVTGDICIGSSSSCP